MGDESTKPVRSWAALWQTVTRFQAEKVTPWLGLRNAIGVTLPLAVGAVTGAVSGGLLVSTGALDASFSDSSEPYIQRGRLMLAASAFVSIAVFTGALSGSNDVVAVVVSAAWAFAAGMLVALGGPAPDVGVISLVTVIVFAAQPLSPEKAAYSGLLAFSGGVLQTLFSVALWPIRRYEPERRALADLYLALSRTAASPDEASQAPPATTQSLQAHGSLATLAQARSIEGERYLALLRQAERMRVGLVTLARIRRRIRRDAAGRPESEILDRCFDISSKLLAYIGNSLVNGETGAASVLPESVAALNQLTERMRESKDEAGSAFIAAMALDARFQIDALAGQIRAAVDLASRATPAGNAEFREREARRPWTLRLRGTMATLRANLSLESAACRHAIRLAACIALGNALARGFGLHRSYWVPMTIAIVLKPDFTSTFSRGVLRLAGTFTGLVAATALFHVLPPALGPQVALIGLLVFVLRCWGPANYGIFVAAVTAIVVLLIALTGIAPADVMAARGANTALGGVIALAAYWIWPTWERTQFSEAMARMLDKFRGYFRVIREGYAQPESSLAQELDRNRVAARLERSNVEAVAERASAEPGTSAEAVKLLSSMLASSHRLAYAMMALEAGLSRSHPVPARKAFVVFATDVELTLYYLASALRGSPLKRGDLPDLREDHHALLSSDRHALVNVEADRITNSLNTLAEDTVRWIAQTRGG